MTPTFFKPTYSQIRFYFNRRKELFSLLNTTKIGSCHRNIGNLIAFDQDEAPVSSSSIQKFLSEHNLNFLKGHTCYILDCPVCLQNANELKIKNQRFPKHQMFINQKTGIHLCYSCKHHGSWNTFQDLISDSSRNKSHLVSATQEEKNTPEWFPADDAVEFARKIYNNSIPLAEFNSQKFNKLLSALNIKGLNMRTLQKFDARVSADGGHLLIPLKYIDGSIIGVYIISQNKNEFTQDEDSIKTDLHIEILPDSLKCALFGWSEIEKSSSKDLILTTSPLDTMAILQETSNLSLALPNGIKNLPLENLPYLECFNSITLWLGNDVASWEAAKIFAHKLNSKRCKIIRPKQGYTTNPHEALQNDPSSIKQIIKTAHPVTHQAITSFKELRDDVIAEFSNLKQASGVKWKRFPLLNKFLKGHRRGELTVLTGSTGSGKTTFMSEYSLDLCTQGVCTLWGSFEVKNVRLAKIMLTQFSPMPLHNHLEQIGNWADKFEKLPLHFMTFHGSQTLKNVLDAMMYAVYIHDIQHVIVDNLQFMMGLDEDVPNYFFDRYLKQDVIISKFRQFATFHNCHVTVVIHPRKENNEELSTSSIFGSAKASQEADNILILQTKSGNPFQGQGRKYIQITKNRFDGELGIIPVIFKRETLSFSPDVASTKTKYSQVAKQHENLTGENIKR